MIKVKQKMSSGVEQRINQISTNVKTLIEMVESERPCTGILCHINHIQHQLQELKAALYIHQIYECISTIQNDSEVPQQLQEIAKLRDLFVEKINYKYSQS